MKDEMISRESGGEVAAMRLFFAFLPYLGLTAWHTPRKATNHWKRQGWFMSLIFTEYPPKPYNLVITTFNITPHITTSATSSTVTYSIRNLAFMKAEI